MGHSRVRVAKVQFRKRPPVTCSFSPLNPSPVWTLSVTASLLNLIIRLARPKPQHLPNFARIPAQEYFRDSRKRGNVAILENSHIVKSIAYVSEKTRFKVFRQSLLKSCFSISTTLFNLSIENQQNGIMIEWQIFP